MESTEFKNLVQELYKTIQTHARCVYEKECMVNLYPRSTKDEIEQYEKEVGSRFPPSYRLFLELHNGWEDYADGFTLIGASGNHTEESLQDIRETIDIYVDEWIDFYGEPTQEKIREYESTENNANPWEDDGSLYIANKLHFGTNFNGDILFFNPAKTQQNGEMEAVYCSTSGGNYGRYPNFIEMLKADLKRLTNEIQDQESTAQKG